MTHENTKLVPVFKRRPLSKLQLGNFVYFELLRMANRQDSVLKKDFYLRMSQIFKFCKSQSKQILYELKDQDLVSIRRGKIYFKGWLNEQRK